MDLHFDPDFAGLNGYKADSSRYFAGIFRPCKRGHCRLTGTVVSDADCGAVGLRSKPVEDMGVCECLVPLRHGGTLNSRRAASSLVWLVGGPRPPLGFSSSKLEWNREKSYCYLHGARS
ncbi:hypothetical protein TNCV_3639901 [Trichonephila clavipes]|nr:hypothetical protein TNCV_3639901 [Trichonephila clavipes]